MRAASYSVIIIRRRAVIDIREKDELKLHHP
jgi:hypothetical protein